MTRPEGERIAVLETHIETLLQRQAKMQEDIEVLKEIFQKAQGAKWVLVSAAAVSGVIATYLPWLAHFLGIVKSG